MKVGSLVTLVDDTNWRSKGHPLYTGVIYPVKDVIYTVREVVPAKVEPGLSILLEEIVNRTYLYKQGESEPYWLARRFREIQPPMDLSFINELQQPKVLACNGSEGAE